MTTLIHPPLSASSPESWMPIANTMTATAVRPMSQPTRNARLFDAARLENSMRIRAMIGTGLIATPTASPRTCPIA